MAIEQNRHGKWRARVRLNGKERYFGAFPSAREARIVETEYKIKVLQDYLEDVRGRRVDPIHAPLVRHEAFG